MPTRHTKLRDPTAHVDYVVKRGFFDIPKRQYHIELIRIQFGHAECIRGMDIRDRIYS